MTDNPSRPAGNFPHLDMPDGLEPTYANLVRISHTPAELVFDFARILPGDTAAHVSSRLLMSPLGAKLFFRALGENLARYEAAYGEIVIPGDPNLVTDLFRGARPPEPPQEDKP
jgi:hypothetical protein